MKIRTIAVTTALMLTSSLAFASSRWYSDSLGLRQNLTPLVMARLRPSPVRSRIRSLSNSAMAARSVEQPPLR